MFSRDIENLQCQAQEMIQEVINRLKKKEISLEEALEVILICFPVLYLKSKTTIEEAIKLFFDRICEEYGDMNELSIQSLMMCFLAGSELISLANASYLFTGTGTNLAAYWRDYVEHQGVKLRGGDKNYQRTILVLELLISKMNAVRFKKFKNGSKSKEDIGMHQHRDESMRTVGHSWAMATMFKELRDTPVDLLTDCCSESVMSIQDASKKSYESIAEEIFEKLQNGEGVKKFSPNLDYTSFETRYVGLGIYEMDDVLWVTIRYRQK